MSKAYQGVSKRIMVEKLGQDVVEKYLEYSAGHFTTKDLWDVLDIKTPENRAYLRVILDRLCKTGVIMRTSKDGVYRKVNVERPEIDWVSADPSKILPIKFPFGIEEHVKIYPKSIVIVAAGKNEGKTAFAYKTIQLNMNNFQVDLYNSETGAEQMKERFEPLGIPIPPPFKTYERYDEFGDVIEPTHLSVIDYMDTNSEVYMVGEEIDKVFRKLTTGVVVICLQKPPPSKVLQKGGGFKVVDRDLAYGGGFTAKRAALYISMGSHKLKLVYVKTPAQKGVNPNNMMWTFGIDDSGMFKDMKRYYGEEEYE